MLSKSAIRTLACCALLLGSPTPASAACGLTKVAQMPLVELGAHYAVMADINGESRPMIVDTGSEVTLIKASAASDLNLPPDYASTDAKPHIGMGQTRAEIWRNVIPSVLAFGDLVYRDRSTAVAEIDDGKLPENDSIGLLGDDILSQFDVEFDFPGRTLTLYRAFGCYDTFIPWTGAYSTIPFEHRRAKVAIDIVLNGERTRAIVDTGNNASFVSRSSPTLSGVPEADFVPAKEVSRSPLNGGTSFPVLNYTFYTVRIGDETLPLRKVRVVDVDFPLGTVNLGLDYWKTRKLWLSYPNKRMFVAYRPLVARMVYPVKETASPPAQPEAKDGAEVGGSSGKVVATDAAGMGGR